MRGTHERLAAMPSPAADWRVLLAPWLSLRGTLGKLHRPIDDEGDGCVDARGVLWFRWQPAFGGASAAAGERAVRQRELQLLVLMATLCHCDRRAFEELLGEVGGEYAQFFLRHRARYEPPAYAMGVYVLVSIEDGIHEITAALPSDPLEDEAFRAVIDVMETHKSARVDKQPRVQVPLWIEFEARGSGPATRAIAETLQLVRRLHAPLERGEGGTVPRLRAARAGSPFVVTTVQFGLNDDEELLDGKTMRQLRELVHAGVRLSSFKIGSPFDSSMSAANIVDSMRTVQALLGPRGVGGGGLLLPRLEMLRLMTPVSTPMLIALSSAIAQSETLRRIDVDHNLERNSGREQFSMERCWRWLACALFSREANHRVEMLEITADVLTEFDVDVVREVATAEDPWRAVMDPHGHSPPLAERLVVDVPAGVEISLLFDYTRVKEDVARFVTSLEYGGLRVTHDDDSRGAVSFILPGWGECSVQRSAVRVRQEDLARASHASTTVLPRGVPHIRLNYISNSNADAVREFVALVGPHVRRLDIHEVDCHGLNVASLVAELIELCPQLDELDLFEVRLASMDPLLRVYTDGKCRAHRIKLRSVTVVAMNSVHGFFGALATPDHAATAHVRELSLHIIERVVQDPQRSSILQSCLGMLRMNDKIRVCRAITLSQRRVEPLERAYSALDGQILPARKAPLALRSKLAFLSVVTTSAEASTAWSRLDTNVMQSIFKFAAETEVRQCQLEVAMTQW